MSTGGGTRAIIAALLANAGIAVAKFVGYLITGSSSMLAESVHSVADTSNQGLLLLGGNRAKRAAKTNVLPDARRSAAYRAACGRLRIGAAEDSLMLSPRDASA